MTDSTTAQAAPPHPVDEILPARQMLPLAMQHVLVMYAGAVTVPLVVGRALGLPEHQLAMLISADLLACGLVTLLQTIGLPKIGIKLPIMMGVTFVSVSPMIAVIGSGMDAGRDPIAILTAIYGGVIVAGLFAFFAAPLMSRMTRFFPPLVTGTIILVIGLNLMRVAINWAAGGVPGSPEYGAPAHLGLAFFTLILILTILRFGRGLVRTAAVLIGAMGGTVVALLFGQANFDEVAKADWVALVTPFQFGLPTFELPIIIAMCLVMVVVMIESTGMFLAAGSMVGRAPDQKAITAGLRADGVGTVIGGIFNTFPYSSYAQNVGLIAITGVKSRFVCATGGGLLILLGLCPKIAGIAAAVPVSVLGGAGFVMFGMIAATGIRILSKVDLTPERLNVIAISVGAGMIPILSEHFFKSLPDSFGPLLHSGIVLAAITSVALNLAFASEDTKPSIVKDTGASEQNSALI